MSGPTLTILGIGHSESERYWNSNAMLESGGRRLLLDCGHTIKPALANVGLSLEDIDAVFVSHIHGDHVFGLERLAFESRYRFNKRVTLYLQPDLATPLWENCLKGSMGNSSSGSNTLEDFFDIELIEGDGFDFAGCQIDAFPTLHTVGKPSYGVVIDGATVYTSDSNVIPMLLEHEGYRLVIHDCTLQEGNPVHANLSTLLDYYPEALRRKMWLVHLDDGFEQRLDQINAEFLGVPHQGQRFMLAR